LSFSSYRAAQKLNLSSKKKKHRPSASSVSESHLFATKFSMILQTSPPPAPPCLLRAVSKVKDTPGVGKVKVMLRICSTLARDSSESSSFLKVDPRKKQITLYDPLSSGSQNAFQKRSTQVPPKMFVFDAVFPQDASQAEVCAGTVAEVIQSVVNGADGCVFCFGHAKLGKSYTMIGKDDSMQNLGIIPCAISWLFKLIHERKEKTGARFSVRISAVEVWGKEEHLRDLLSEVATGSLQDGQSPGVYLSEDPICGMQLQNQSELRAPTAEKAAFFLDAAIAARRSSQQDCQEEEQKNSHMLFTLHIYQYRMEKSGKGGMSGGRSRLHLIDLGSCVKPLSKNREGGSALCLSLSALGNVILALVNGSKHIPFKDSKLTMLLRESLGNMNCRTTMIAHISAAAGNYAETLSTIQIASRVLRMKKKKTKYTSSSSGGESSCEEGRMRRPTQLRPFHSRNVVDPDFPILHLSSDPDYSSSSEQSCDTVIYVGPNGTALSDKELTDNEGPPDFVPIVPALQKAKNEGKLEDMNETAPERDCLKCNTFAELQERLDCIDGSEETDGFLFEELPVQFNSDPVTKCSLSGQETEHCSASDPSREDDLVVCQEPDKDAKENLNATASQIQGGHSPVHSRMLNEISTPQAHWNVTGSPSSQINSSQQPHCTDLQSSRESLNSSGFLENKPRPMGSPRLGIASLSKASDYKPPASPSQRCKVYTQKGVLPNPAPPPSSLSKDSGMVSSESLMQSEIRTPPIGMSPQILKKSLSSGNIDYTEVVEKAEQQQESLSPESKQEILSTTMVTVQQPLELNGEDELVFTLVEELTISGVLENGRPTSIISFNSDCSVQALASGSRPVSIISSISEDLECYSSTAPISELSITQFLPLPKMGLVDKAEEAESRRSSISSWLSEMSTGSDGEQSCHSFIAQASYGHGEAMAEAPPSELAKAVCINDKQNRCTEDMFVSPEGVDRNTNKLSPIRSCKISALEKTTVTISNTTSVSSCEGFLPMKTNITVFPRISVNSFKAQEGHEAIASVSSSARTPYLHEGKESNARKDLKFDDPWLKREDCAKNEHGLKAETVPDQNKKQNSADRFSSSSGEISSSPGTENPRRVIDECETGLPGSATHSPLHSTESLKNGSLSRGFRKNNKLEELDVISYHYVEESGGMSSSVSSQTSKASLERKIASPKHGVLTRPKGTPPLPPVRKSSLEQKNRASPQHNACSSSTSSSSNQPPSFLASFPDEPSGKQKGSSMESGSNSSSKLFSAKLEQLASRTNSLGRSNGSHYECLSLERAESLSSVSSKMNIGKDTTMPRASRSLNRNAISSPTNSGFSQSAGASPKASQSKISAVSKLLLASPKARSLAASTTKTLSFSTKSLPQSVGQSSSLPPNGKNMSWSTQSLSRNRGSGLSSKLPLRAVNGRISELLQGNAGTRGMQLCRNSDTDERSSIHGDKKPSVHLLPSPYSKITPPRKPHRCSSGHGSDNSSVLSGELPPAMGKTALFYHSGGSSGYESMIRDSEATGSTSSAQDSMSENSSSISGRCRSLKTPKKRSNTGSQRRRLIPALSLDTTSPIRKPTNPAIRWVDGPLRSAQRGMGEPFEIKVYEIDDVERLQRRRMGDNNEVICYNAKLKILEHRQQRIAEVKAKYEWLMRELEVTKQYLMLDPNKWLSEFDLEHVFDSDSLEYLEALECVTERLENRVNYCKAHLMMITCFDISSRRR
ncbi:kinesin-like protein KIF26B, partial [Crotalus tigris]|uniref:kinesin-like protein KIF26B n=1 Tax=Crotalus tigris TaxID=88082 RepID=UPI00192FA335